MKRLIIFPVLLVSFSAFSAPIIGGKEASESSRKDGVFQFAIQEIEDEGYGYCTATKIGKSTFITAAHCFDDNKDPAHLGISTRIKNKDFQFDDRVEVERILIHPTYSAENENLDIVDVAIVVVKPAEGFTNLETRKIDFVYVQSDNLIEYFGFGCQETTNNIDDYFPVKKHAQNTTLGEEALKRNFGAYTEYIHENSKTIYEVNLLTAGLNISKEKSSVCFGDSGGPVFLNGKIVGINASFLTDFNEDGTTRNSLTDVNTHIRVSPIKNWILENLKD